MGTEHTYSRKSQNKTLITPEIGKSELCFMSTPTGPTGGPCWCSASTFVELCKSDNLDSAWKLVKFEQTYPGIVGMNLKLSHPVLFNWICNAKDINFHTLVQKYNKFAKETGLKEF